MDQATIRLVFTYLVAILVLVGAFVLIFTSTGDSGQAWLAIGAVMGYIFRDAGGAAATNNAIRVANATNGAPVP
jgi:hypothetical protein